MSEDWANAETLEALKPEKLSDPLFTGSRFLSVDASGDLVLLGGSNGDAGVFSVSQKKLVQTIKGAGGSIADGLWAGDRTVLATSTGSVRVYSDGAEVSRFSGHAGGVTSLSLHPSGEILASVGVDKSYIFYDLASSSVATDHSKL